LRRNIETLKFSFLPSFPGYFLLFLIVVVLYFPAHRTIKETFIQKNDSNVCIDVFLCFTLLIKEVFKNEMNNHNRMKRPNKTSKTDLIRWLNRMTVQSKAEINTTDCVIEMVCAFRHSYHLTFLE